MPSLPRGCLVVRTYFADDSAWEQLKIAAEQPDAYSGYIANVSFVNDRTWGVGCRDLKGADAC